MAKLSNGVANFLRVQPHNQKVSYKKLSTTDEGSYGRQLVEYSDDEGSSIRAYLLEPKVSGPLPAVLIHHQHNGERHLGKSEVCGLAGNPLQAFGPALAEKGFLVLAPDSICFEDRRPNKRGIEADIGEADWLQHYNEMTYRIAKGDTLMRKVLHDASIGVSLLLQHQKTDSNRVGVLGHSYGGNTVLFQMAIDSRISFGVSSGAACTYKNKMENQTGLEMALAIPEFASKWEISDLVAAACPRKLLLVAGTDDKYSKDADEIYESTKPTFEKVGAGQNLVLKQYSGGHALDQERFDFIINWVALSARGN